MNLLTYSPTHLLTLCWALLPSIACAQVTADLLIGRYVEDAADPKYRPVAEAIADFQGGDAESAAAKLAEAAGANPELPPGPTMAASLYFAAGNRAAARAALERATQEAPGDPEAYLVMADLALGEGRLTEAELLYRQGGALCASYDRNELRRRLMQAGSLSGLCAASAARDRWAEVEKAAAAWLADSPQSLQAKTWLGRSQFHRQQYQQAYATFQEIYKADPQAPRPEISMGLLYEELVARGDEAKRESARNAMLLAAEQDPDTLLTRLAVARWALNACLIDVATENAEAAVKLDGQSFDALMLAGEAAWHSGALDAAESRFRAALMRSPASFPAAAGLSLVLAGQGRSGQEAAGAGARAGRRRRAR